MRMLAQWVQWLPVAFKSELLTQPRVNRKRWFIVPPASTCMEKVLTVDSVFLFTYKSNICIALKCMQETECISCTSLLCCWKDFTDQKICQTFYYCKVNLKELLLFLQLAISHLHKSQSMVSPWNNRSSTRFAETFNLEGLEPLIGLWSSMMGMRWTHSGFTTLVNGAGAAANELSPSLAFWLHEALISTVPSSPSTACLLSLWLSLYLRLFSKIHLNLCKTVSIS